MSQDHEDPQPVGQGRHEAVPPELAGGVPGEALDTQFPDLVAYCRGLTSHEEDAVSAAHTALGAAQALLNDPDQLRAWLFGLARREAVADAEPPAREVLDLINRHGIRPEDLPSVLGVPPAEADELLAAAEEQYGSDGSWDDRADWDDNASLYEELHNLPPDASLREVLGAQLAGLVAYSQALTGQQDDAVRIAHAVLGLAESLLDDPDRLRAWLFALARREMLADAAADGREVLELVHRHGIRAEDLPIVLGIEPAEADELLAAAEDSYASSAFDSAHHDAGPRHSDSPRDDSRWDDPAVWDDGGFWSDGPRWTEDPDLRDRRLEPAGRHAAPHTGGAGIRQTLARGPVRAAAAAGIVVAVIGGSVAYLASANSPAPSQASQQRSHPPRTLAPSPATSASPTPTPTPKPTQSTTPAQPVNVVVPPPPAPTSPPASPKPSPKPTSPSPSPTSPSPSPTSPSPSPSSS